MDSSNFLISVHFRNMNTHSIFVIECFLAMVTIVAEVTREVNTFNVIPDIDLLRVLLSTQRALEALPPIPKQGLLHVLVKRHSSSVIS